MIFKNKKIAVIGLGKSGFAAANFLIEKGAKVSATDSSGKPEILENGETLQNLGAWVEVGQHTEKPLKGVSLVVTSPGVPKKSFPLEYARKKKIPVISEIELAYFNCKGSIVGITGTNGKTTTSHLIHKIITDAGRKSNLCGNIGYSFLDATREITAGTTVTLELSSFQLEDSPRFRPSIAVILNISPNHLDRHKTIGEYARAKENIFKNQKKEDVLILNFDDPIVRRMAPKALAKVIFFSKFPLKQGIFLNGESVVARFSGRETEFLSTKNFRLQGQHNLENILAAVAVAWALKIPKQSIQKTVDLFETLEHRIEPVGEIKGIYFVNDSKSTTVESTRAAIMSIKTPLILIAGGRDKGSDFSLIESTVNERVKKVILYGEARELIKRSWESFDRYALIGPFKEAVVSAFHEAVPGDTVLLSPMCASFDQFNSYGERGKVFKKIFNELKER